MLNILVVNAQEINFSEKESKINPTMVNLSENDKQPINSNDYEVKLIIFGLLIVGIITLIFITEYLNSRR